MKRVLVLLLATLSFAAEAQQRNFDATVIKTTKLTESHYMLEGEGEGEGSNIGMSVGEVGIMMIDDQFAALTPKILAAIRAISDKPINFLLNTHVHGDHVGDSSTIANIARNHVR
jgi:glyoxylase-like metal-dependent hydrolase (beta-lactamase superfamily II)